MRLSLPLPRGDRRGFTLIEILVVLVLIGILTAIATRSLRDDETASRRQTVAADVTRLIQLASDKYPELGRYPALTDLAPTPVPGTANTTYAIVNRDATWQGITLTATHADGGVCTARVGEWGGAAAGGVVTCTGF